MANFEAYVKSMWLADNAYLQLFDQYLQEYVPYIPCEGIEEGFSPVRGGSLARDSFTPSKRNKPAVFTVHPRGKFFLSLFSCFMLEKNLVVRKNFPRAVDYYLRAEQDGQSVPSSVVPLLVPGGE